MRRIILFLSFFSAFFSADVLRAQNWEIYKNGDSLLFYRDGHGYDSTSVFIKADSITVGQATTFTMNRRVIDGNNNFNYYGNFPFLLQRKIIHYSNDNWLLSDTANWVLQPRNSLLSSWIFDTINGINASITRLYYGQVLGQSDSIKTISLSNGDSILVSKNYGIIYFPSSLSGTSNYTLAAYNHSVSDTVPGFFKMFAFQPGDIFEYTSYDYHYNFNSSQSFPYLGNFRDSIISIQYSTSGVTVHLYQWSHISHDQTNLFSQDTLTKTYLASDYKFLDYEANNSVCNYPAVSPFNYQEFMLYGYSLIFNCKTKNYSAPLQGNNYSANLTSMINFPSIAYPVYSFGDGIGLLNISGDSYDPFFSSGTSFDSSLVGLKRSNQVYGTIHTIDFFTEEVYLPVLAPFPNPAENSITVSASSPSRQATVEILDVRGRLLFNENFTGSATLDLQQFSNGLYILRIYEGSIFIAYKIVHFTPKN